MKINKISKKNRELIINFLTTNGMQGIINYCNFTLLDKSPLNNYFSYYVECDGRIFGIIIDYDKNVIYIHKDYKVKLSMNF